MKTRPAQRSALLLGASGVLVIGLAAAVFLVPQLRWRAKVVLLKATGKMHDVEWSDLATFLLPGPEAQVFDGNVDRRNPYVMIVNKRTTPLDLQRGAKLFEHNCADCHGRDGGGGAAGPSLTGGEFRHGGSDWALYRTIRYGVPGTAMPPHAMSSTDIWQLVAHIRALGGARRPGAGRAPDETRAAGINVPYQDIVAARAPSADWLTYSGSYSGQRHSSLAAITAANANLLSVRWIHQFDGPAAKIEASPIVRNGVMYLTLTNGGVMACDAASGRVVWIFRRADAESAAAAGTFPNRGLAILDDKVFFATADAKLIALSAATGALVWQASVAQRQDGYVITGAPLAYRDLVVTGVAMTPGTPGRGFIAAFDAATGRERWRFQTIPAPGEPHSDSWQGDSWQHGGAPTWMTGSYDPDDDMLFWGVGNPSPDYDAASRPGDNLYSESVVALSGTTGKLAWHFQFTPGDDHDWDSTEIPILVDGQTKDGTGKQLLFANRNGFYYVLDRLRGRFIKAAAFVQQNWTKGIDANGRPLPPPTDFSQAGTEGRLLYPGNAGATNWWSPTFDPALHLVFVNAIEQPMYYYRGNAYPQETGSSFYTAVRALDASDGKLVWEYRSKPRTDTGATGSLLSTAGGVVFGSDLSTFFALESATGRLLWSVETGGIISSPPVTYSVGGEQFVATSAGRDLIAFALPRPHQ
jgi:alcohol dehydrogenase (cytochrome c)